MKSLLKRAIRALKCRLVPVLRPLVRKVEGRLSRLVEATVRPLVIAELERHVRPALDATATAVRESIDRNDDVLRYLRRSAQEDTLLLDSLVRELVRVQLQLEALEQLADDRMPVRSSLHVASDPADPFAPRAAAIAEERLMVG